MQVVNILSMDIEIRQLDLSSGGAFWLTFQPQTVGLANSSEQWNNNRLFDFRFLRTFQYPPIYLLLRGLDLGLKTPWYVDKILFTYLPPHIKNINFYPWDVYNLVMSFMCKTNKILKI